MYKAARSLGQKISQIPHVSHQNYKVLVKNILESGKSCKNNSHFPHHKKGSVKVGKLVNLGNPQPFPSKLQCPNFWYFDGKNSKSSINTLA